MDHNHTMQKTTPQRWLQRLALAASQRRRRLRWWSDLVRHPIQLVLAVSVLTSGGIAR